MKKHDKPLKILIIDANDARAAVVKDGLKAIEFAEILRTSMSTQLMTQIQAMDPDMIIIDCDSPDRDTLESMRMVSACNPKPIIMFVEEDDPDFARQAIEAGVSAYIVAGLNAKRIKPILDVAMTRFRLFQALRTDLEKAQSDLASRKIVERAKGILMQEKNLTEEKAYRLLRRVAMNEGKPILEIADNIIAVTRLLKQ